MKFRLKPIWLLYKVGLSMEKDKMKMFREEFIALLKQFYLYSF